MPYISAFTAFSMLYQGSGSTNSTPIGFDYDLGDLSQDAQAIGVHRFPKRDDSQLSSFGYGSKLTTRKPQVLVLVSIHQGKPFWGDPIFDPQPFFLLGGLVTNSGGC